MARALDELILEGLPTTIPFHRATMRHAGFRAGFYSTDSADQWLRETEIVR
jgi:biotin carboxylase